jgi:hypothetical protein
MKRKVFGSLWGHSSQWVEPHVVVESDAGRAEWRGFRLMRNAQ